MRFSTFALVFILIPSIAVCRKISHELEIPTKTARNAADQLAKNPPPE